MRALGTDEESEPSKSPCNHEVACERDETRSEVRTKNLGKGKTWGLYAMSSGVSIAISVNGWRQCRRARCWRPSPACRPCIRSACLPFPGAGLRPNFEAMPRLRELGCHWCTLYRPGSRTLAFECHT